MAFIRQPKTWRWVISVRNAPISLPTFVKSSSCSRIKSQAPEAAASTGAMGPECSVSTRSTEVACGLHLPEQASDTNSLHAAGGGAAEEASPLKTTKILYYRVTLCYNHHITYSPRRARATNQEFPSFTNVSWCCLLPSLLTNRIAATPFKLCKLLIRRPTSSGLNYMGY